MGQSECASCFERQKFRICTCPKQPRNNLLGQYDPWEAVHWQVACSSKERQCLEDVSTSLAFSRAARSSSMLRSFSFLKLSGFSESKRPSPAFLDLRPAHRKQNSRA